MGRKFNEFECLLFFSVFRFDDDTVFGGMNDIGGALERTGGSSVLKVREELREMLFAKSAYFASIKLPVPFK